MARGRIPIEEWEGLPSLQLPCRFGMVLVYFLSIQDMVTQSGQVFNCQVEARTFRILHGSWINFEREAAASLAAAKQITMDAAKAAQNFYNKTGLKAFLCALLLTAGFWQEFS